MYFLRCLQEDTVYCAYLKSLAVLNYTPPPPQKKKNEKEKKEICKIFTKNGLRITTEANENIVNFLDVTLDLNTGKS